MFNNNLIKEIARCLHESNLGHLDNNGRFESYAGLSFGLRQKVLHLEKRYESLQEDFRLLVSSLNMERTSIKIIPATYKKRSK